MMATEEAWSTSGPQLVAALWISLGGVTLVKEACHWGYGFEGPVLHLCILFEV